MPGQARHDMLMSYKCTIKSKRISILGATGSIGDSAFRLIDAHPEKFSLTLLTAQRNAEKLVALARKYQPEAVAIADDTHYGYVKEALADTEIRVFAGTPALNAAAEIEADIVLSAITGAAALMPTLAAIRKGYTVALANKECLVMAGHIIMKEAREHKATLLPVDSEHNAIFQICAAQHSTAIQHITLTASGGPFRKWTHEQMQLATKQEALNHPNWSMGEKITIDSATMMNKGLEWIEACHLFDVEPEQIQVLIHPESIVHGLVSYVDGSVIAQMGNPDMCTPIAYALAWPERIAAPVAPLNLAEVGALTFDLPDAQRFPALGLVKHAHEMGGGAPAVLNAANEEAVELFLSEKIEFLEIAKTVEKTLNNINIAGESTIESILEMDGIARAYVREMW